MLGSMLAVGLTNILFDYAALPMAVKVFAQAISGAFIGMQIGRKDVARMRGLIVPFLLLAVMLTVNTFVVGIAIQKLCGWDWITALLSLRGRRGYGYLADRHGDGRGCRHRRDDATARLVGVLLFFPYWIQFVTRHEPKTAPVTEEKPLDAAHAAGPADFNTVLADCLHAAAQHRVRLSGQCERSAGGVDGVPMIAVAALNCTTSVCAVPLAIKNIAQLLAGSLVGVSITAATFSSLSSTLVPVGLLFAQLLDGQRSLQRNMQADKAAGSEIGDVRFRSRRRDGHVADRRRSGRGSLADCADPGAACGVCRRGDAAADPRFYPVDRIAERKGKR